MTRSRYSSRGGIQDGTPALLAFAIYLTVLVVGLVSLQENLSRTSDVVMAGTADVELAPVAHVAAPFIRANLMLSAIVAVGSDQLDKHDLSGVVVGTTAVAAISAAVVIVGLPLVILYLVLIFRLRLGGRWSRIILTGYSGLGLVTVGLGGGATLMAVLPSAAVLALMWNPLSNRYFARR